MKTPYSKLSIIAVVLLLVPQVTFAAWWNPASWFSAETQYGEQGQAAVLVSSSTPPIAQAVNVPAPDTKTIEGLREEVAVLKARLADLESRFSSTQTSTAIQPALTVVDVSPRVAALEKRVDTLSNPDTSRLTKLEQKVAALSNLPTDTAPVQTKNYDSQISEMAKRINALMHAGTINDLTLRCTLGIVPTQIGKMGIYPACTSVYADLHY